MPYISKFYSRNKDYALQTEIIKEKAKDYNLEYKSNKQNLPPFETYAKLPLLNPQKRDISLRLPQYQKSFVKRLLRIPIFKTQKALIRFHPQNVRINF